MIGIYRIINIKNNKCYVGQSKDIDARIKKHKNFLLKNKHWNNHLQNAWNKYGEENFKFEIIEECKEEELNDREIYWIKYYDSLRNGYNKTSGGDGIKNYKHAEETKKKISKASKRFKLSPEHKQKLIEANTGRKKSKQELEKLSKAAKGRKISEWHKQQLINSTKGKPLSEEHKKKISRARKGFKMSEEQKEKLRNINKGKPSKNRKLSQEDRKNIAEMFLKDPYLTVDEIAKKYNVSVSTIYGIKKEYNIPRKKLTEQQKQQISKTLKGRKLTKQHRENISKAVKKNNGYSKYTENEIKKVIELLLQGKTNKEIEKLTNVSYTVILNVRKKKSWTHLTKGLNIPDIKCKNQYK